MRDLEVWRRLVSAAVTASDMRALGHLPIGRRAPYIGRIAAFATTASADVELRVEALTALAGCRGAPGIRAIVAGLDDEDESIRGAAIRTLMICATDAPARSVHALFHPRVEVRRAAVACSLPQAVAEIAVYLRADPECAELAAKLAWPGQALPLALDLYDGGQLPASELVAVIARRPVAELRALFQSEHRRGRDQVGAYFTDASRAGRLIPASGRDVMDSIVSALATFQWPSLETWSQRRERAREIEMFVGAVATRGDSALVRRAAVSLASYFASHPPVSVMIAVLGALEPRTIELGLDPTAVAAGLVRLDWPTRAEPAQLDRLVLRAAGDLALAAALVGMLPSERLAKLAELLGEDAIIDSLVASDRGWDEICALAGETGVEQRWLAAVARRDEDRYAALVSRAMLRSTGKRLDLFVAQVPRTQRRVVFGTALLGTSDREVIASICKAIADRLDRGTLSAIISDALRAADRGPPILLGLARAAPEKILAAAVGALHDADVSRVIAILDGPDPAPRDRELAIAHVLAARSDPTIVAWAARVVAPAAVQFPSRRMIEPKRNLDAVERARISSCSARDLPRAVAPALTAPVAGLVGALESRSPQPCVEVCAALLGCADRLDMVARQLDRFAASTRDFEIDLDNAVTTWLRRDDISPLAHARLYRWEHHTAALADWIDEMGGVVAALRLVDQHPGWLFAQTMWRGISEAVMFFRYRDAARFARYGSVELAEFAADRVDRHYGHHAARIVVALVEGRAVPVIAIRERVLDRIADAGPVTRAYAARLVRLDGIPEPVRAIDLGDPREAIAEIRAETDLDRLVAWCADPRPLVAQEAALALVIAGEPGQHRLAALLDHLDAVAVPLAVLATVVLWELPAAIERARQLAATIDLPAAWRFHLALALGDLPRAFEAARDTSSTWYFRRDDWDTLARAVGELDAAIALADAPHHHAYQRAVPVLLAHPDASVVGDALRRFLASDGERPLYLRRSVVRYLAERLGDFTGLPLLVEQVIDESVDTWETALAAIPDAAVADAAEMIVSAALVGGHPACSEKRMSAVLERLRSLRRLDRDVLDALCLRVLEDASQAGTRRVAAAYAIRPEVEDARLGRVAEVFAWGVRRGVELTGRMFRFRTTGREQDLGHTNLSSNHVFVSPLPMLRDEPHGKDVVEGLVLHEIGHHIYHRSPAALAVWKRAHAEGIGHLLNLVADEHLERNLRGIDATYGDRLKRLGAYAFHHAPQEIAVAKLLESLRGSTARALIAADLGVAYDEAAVRLRRGEVLATLDRAGHPLARFSRALRMGLGNRHRDPLVATALAMCGAKLRDLDMAGLYELTKRLAAMFGGAIACARVFGGPEGLEFGERDDDVFGNLNDDILQREVERILDPRRSSASSSKSGPRGRLWINVNPNEEFDKITRIERVKGDEAAHRAVARSVARHSARLRAYLDDLGLRWEPMKARLSGRTLDRSRLRALVTRNDPRILIARRAVRKTDLFLGTLVDCSGSMKAGDNIDRARRFAIMIAEAVAPLQGVEARFFGFTDSVIFDAGDAHACDVVALETSGGNNDAAALFHVANLAAASPKHARVLVMISDGLPTECSVEALRGLVKNLSKRRGFVCAQVAVRELDEICFPHYVVLDDREPDVAVARFGRLIGDLARRSLVG